MKKEDVTSKQQVNLIPTFILIPLGLVLLVVLAISFSNNESKIKSGTTQDLSVLIQDETQIQPSISAMICGRDKKTMSSCKER